MIDFVQIISYINTDKVTPIFENCNLIGQRGDNRLQYELKGVDRMQVEWWADLGRLVVAGSLPRYLQGHNFHFTLKDCYNSIMELSSLLGVDLMEGHLSQVENGVVFPVEMKPADYIKHHYCNKDSKLKQSEKYDGRERYWADTSTGKVTAPLVLKMYDAGYRLKSTTTKRNRPNSSLFVPDNEYIKFENHYNSLDHLSGGGVFVSDLFTEEWQNKFSIDLLKQYERLKTMKELAEPTRKEDATAIDIALRLLVEDAINDGRSVEDVKRRFYDKVNSMPILTKQDADKRKQTFRKAKGKLRELPQDKYNLGGKIKEALYIEEQENEACIDSCGKL